MPYRSAHGRRAPLVVLMIVGVVAGCGQGNAGEAEYSKVPAVEEAATSASDARSAPATQREPRAPTREAARPPAQPAATPAEPAPTALVVAQGTALAFAVGQTLSTDKQKTGDRFTATLAEPVMGPDGAPILEAGTVGRWVVTESTARNSEGQAVLSVALEALEFGGTWYPVQATVTELSLKTDTPDSGGETAAKIGVGAAAGALAGKLLGGSKSATLKGAGAGAALGTAMALATRGGSASIQQGSKITATLDQKLELPPR